MTSRDSDVVVGNSLTAIRRVRTLTSERGGTGKDLLVSLRSGRCVIMARVFRVRSL